MKTDLVLDHNFKELLLYIYDDSAIEFEIKYSKKLYVWRLKNAYKNLGGIKKYLEQEWVPLRISICMMWLCWHFVEWIFIALNTFITII